MVSARSLAVIAFAATWLAGASLAAANEPLVTEEKIPGKFSANVALTTEYFFRGISQSDDVPAIQGGFDYEASLPKGLDIYLGTWASNVNFTDAVIEIDYYGGVRGKIGGLGWDLGLIYYSYPGAAGSRNYDFWETALSFGYELKFASLSAGINISPDNFGASGFAAYPQVGVDVPIGKHFTVSGHLGYQVIDDNKAFGSPDYLDYSIGASTNLFGFDVELKWTDTDMSESECSDACGMVIFTASRSF